MKRNLFWGLVFVFSNISLVYYFFLFFGNGKEVVKKLVTNTSFSNINNIGYVNVESKKKIQTEKEVRGITGGMKKLDEKIQHYKFNFIHSKRILTGKNYTGGYILSGFKNSLKRKKRFILKRSIFLSGRCFNNFENEIPLNFFSGVVLTGVICKTGNIYFFSSYKFSCPDIKRYLLTGWIKLFVDEKFLKMNKFIGEKVCFLNFSDSDNKVYRGIKYKNEWHWFILSKHEYYKLKLKLWHFYKNK